MFQLLLSGFLWQLHHLKSFLIAIAVFCHTCVCQLTCQSCKILWDFFIVHSAIMKSTFLHHFHLVHIHKCLLLLRWQYHQ
ncbi:hypothetical protein CsSME_00053926 [Camellia sinensis var. sinensis]